MVDVTRPTLQSASWSMTGFLDTALKLLRSDTASRELRLYFYAATSSGWDELEDDVVRWVKKRPGRTATAYIGTDHGLTDPVALDEMRKRIKVRLMRRYNGIYHPKVIWFLGGSMNELLVGSNNLTRDGLRNNIEFGTWTRLAGINPNLKSWHDAVHEASDPLDSVLQKSYAKERQAHAQAMAKAAAKKKSPGTFTWSKRSSGSRQKKGTPPGPTSPSAQKVPTGDLDLATSGALVMEIMPLETGAGGCQVQVPLEAAKDFFGLGSQVGAKRTITLRNPMNGKCRSLQMTLFKNHTARLVISDLDYSDRPCVMVFRKAGSNGPVDFQIVPKAVDPDGYRELLRLCGSPTRSGSRRWTVLK